MSTQKNIPKLLFSGKKRTGKTLLASHIKRKIPGTIEMTFAEPLKQACKHIFLLSDKQLYDEEVKEEIDHRWGVSPRVLFQKIGDLFRDHLHEMIPELKLPEGSIFTQNMYWRLDDLSKESVQPNLFVFPDGRSQDEKKFIKSLPNSHSLLLLRDTGSTDNHRSEQTFECDHIIDNNGSTSELYEKVDKILDKINTTIHVNAPWFEYIKNGTKIFEGRSMKNDKIRNCRVGDIVNIRHFTDTNLVFMAKIANLYYFSDFLTALNTLGLEQTLPGIQTIDEGVNIYYKFVSEETQQKFGVCMIQLALI